MTPDQIRVLLFFTEWLKDLPRDQALNALVVAAHELNPDTIEKLRLGLAFSEEAA